MNTNERLHKHQNNEVSKCVAKKGEKCMSVWACSNSSHLSLPISLSSFLKCQKNYVQKQGPKVCCALWSALSDLTSTNCSQAP